VAERETMIMGEDREIQMGGKVEIKLLSFSCSVPFVNSPVVFSFYVCFFFSSLLPWYNLLTSGEGELKSLMA